MRRLGCAALSCLIPLVSAGEPTKDPACLVSAPDLARTRTRLEGSIYHEIWNDPLLAKARAAVEQAGKDTAKDVGVDPYEVVKALTQLSLRLPGEVLPEQEPPFAVQIQVSAGAQNDPLWKAVLKEGKPAADGKSVELPDKFHGRLMTEGLVFANSPTALTWTAPKAGTADLVIEVLGPKLADMIAKVGGIPPEQMEQVKLWLKGQDSGQIQVVADGIQEEWTNNGPFPYLTQVDLAPIKGLPSTTLAAIAVAFDGPVVWKDLIEPQLTLMVNKMGQTLPDLDKQFSEQFKAAGVDTNLARFVSGLSGTVTIGLTPGIPAPFVTLVVPTGESWDHLIKLAHFMTKQPVPAVGGTGSLPAEGLPMLIQVSHQEKTWTISSDPNAIGAPAGPGFGDSPVFQAALKATQGKTPMALGVLDTQAVLRMANGYLGLANMFVKELGIDMGQIKALLTKVTAKAGPGHFSLIQADDRTILRAKSLVGGPGTLLGIAGMAGLGMMMRSGTPEFIAPPNAP